MFCKNCGQEIKDNAQFCKNCGIAVTKRTDNAAGVRGRSSTGLIVGIAAGAVILIFLITAFGYPGFLRQGAGSGDAKNGDSANMSGKSSGKDGFFGNSEDGTESDIIEVEIPRLTKERQDVLVAGNYALKAYIDARMWTEKLDMAAKNKDISEEELAKMVDNCAEAWRIAASVAGTTESMGKLLEEAEVRPDYKGTITAKLDTNTGELYSDKGGLIIQLEDPFTVPVYAAEKKEMNAQEWAKQITEIYDSGPTGKQVRTLAEHLGVDAKTAYKQLVMAQNIIKGEAEMEEANLYDTCLKVCQATKTGCKVVGYGCAVVATGGVAAGVSGAVVATGTLTVGGVDCVVDVFDTTAVILTGENSQVTAKMDELKEAIAPVAAISGAVGVLTGDFSKATDVVQGLQYVAEGVLDYVQEGKIMGISPEKWKEKGESICKLFEKDVPKPGDEKAITQLKEDLKEIGLSEEEANAVVAVNVAQDTAEVPKDTAEDKPAGTEAGQEGDQAAIQEAAEEYTDIGSLIDWESLSPQEIEEIMILVDILEEENNPENTVEQMYDELVKSIEDTYDIVVGYDPAGLTGTYHFINATETDWTRGLDNIANLFNKNGEEDYDKHYPPMVVEYEDGKLLIQNKSGYLNDVLGDGEYDRKTGTLVFDFEEERKGTVYVGQLKLVFTENDAGDTLLHATAVQNGELLYENFYVRPVGE